MLGAPPGKRCNFRRLHFRKASVGGGQPGVRGYNERHVLVSDVHGA